MHCVAVFEAFTSVHPDGQSSRLSTESPDLQNCVIIVNKVISGLKLSMRVNEDPMYFVKLLITENVSKIVNEFQKCL